MLLGYWTFCCYSGSADYKAAVRNICLVFTLLSFTQEFHVPETLGPAAEGSTLYSTIWAFSFEVYLWNNFQIHVYNCRSTSQITKGSAQNTRQWCSFWLTECHFLSVLLIPKTKTKLRLRWKLLSADSKSHPLLAADTNNSQQKQKCIKKFPPLDEVVNACIQHNMQLNPVFNECRDSFCTCTFWLPSTPSLSFPSKKKYFS